MVGREPVRVGVRADVLEAQRPRIPDEEPEDPVAARERTDPRALLVVDSNSQELLELPFLLVQDAERGVARTCDLARDLEYPVEHVREVELRDEGAADFDEPLQTLASELGGLRARGHRSNLTRLRRTTGGLG